MNPMASCFLTCLLALLMSISCFGVQMGPIPTGLPMAMRDPLEPSIEYPNEPSMVEYPLDYPVYPSMEYPFGQGGQTGPDMNDNMMGTRVRRSPRKPSMVENPMEPPTEYPMDPLMEYPIDLSMEYPIMYPWMENPMRLGGHTEPDMNDNMMGSRSRRSPRKPCKML